MIIGSCNTCYPGQVRLLAAQPYPLDYSEDYVAGINNAVTTVNNYDMTKIPWGMAAILNVNTDGSIQSVLGPSTGWLSTIVATALVEVGSVFGGIAYGNNDSPAVTWIICRGQAIPAATWSIKGYGPCLTTGGITLNFPPPLGGGGACTNFCCNDSTPSSDCPDTMTVITNPCISVLNLVIPAGAVATLQAYIGAGQTASIGYLYTPDDSCT